MDSEFASVTRISSFQIMSALPVLNAEIINRELRMDHAFVLLASPISMEYAQDALKVLFGAQQPIDASLSVDKMLPTLLLPKHVPAIQDSVS